MSDLTNARLKQAVANLARAEAKDAEAVRTLAKYIDDEAQDTARIAESIASFRVDNDTVSETHELSKIMAGLSEATISYASAGETVSKLAQAVHSTAGATHDGIEEAFARSAASNVYDLDRGWLEQE
jgi:hypothetical protein